MATNPSPTATPAPPIPFTNPSNSGWLNQIAAAFLKAWNGDQASLTSIRTTALYTDAQWNAAHADVANATVTYAYARNAYKAAYAQLVNGGKYGSAGPATANLVQAPAAVTSALSAITTNPTFVKYKTFILLGLVGLALWWLMKSRRRRK